MIPSESALFRIEIVVAVVTTKFAETCCLFGSLFLYVRLYTDKAGPRAGDYARVIDLREPVI